MSTTDIFSMEDITPVLDTRYVSFSQDGEIRSPRTPTWSSLTPSSPFEYDKFLSTTPPKETKRGSLPPAPDAPLPWVWQCHLCRNRYQLGVTRRCLYDGHYYCSGDTGQLNLKKKKGRACSSEFDYEGWEEYGNWRQRALQELDNPRVSRACETCMFPSQCRTPASSMPAKREKKKTAPPAQEPKKTLSVKNGDDTTTDETMIDVSLVSSRASMVDFDSILQDLLEADKEMSPKSEEGPKRSKSKERNFSRKIDVSAEEKEQEILSQTFLDSIKPMFDVLSGKTKTTK